MFKYFCDYCGHRFTDERPLHNELGLWNDIPCPSCGSWCILPDTKEGSLESLRAGNEYERTLILWDDDYEY